MNEIGSKGTEPETYQSRGLMIDKWEQDAHDQEVRKD